MCDYIVDCMRRGDITALKSIIRSMSNINDAILIDEENNLNLLHLAAGISSDHRDEILELLLEKGADANYPGKQDQVTGVRALHIASSWGYDTSVKMLLLFHAETTVRDSDGYSPIDYASVYDNYTCISILLKYGSLNTSSDTSNWSHVFETSAGDSSTASFTFNRHFNHSAYTSSRTPSSKPNLTQSLIDQISKLDTFSETSYSYHTASEDETTISPFNKSFTACSNNESDSCNSDLETSNIDLDLDQYVTRESVETNLDKLGKDYARLLRDELQKYGQKPGPITLTTRGVYMKLLLSLQRSNDLARKVISNTLDQKLGGYSSELKSLLSGQFPFSEAQELEKEFITTSDTDMFHGPKQFFNYLLLDPRISNNMCNQMALNSTPLNGTNVSKVDQKSYELLFTKFIKAIFYIGKGQKKRDLAHLYDALADRDAITKAKIDQIRSIWSDGFGVVSLHIFNNISDREALTREALIIDAIGLGNLTNIVKGTIKIRMTWNDHKRKLLGSLLLWKAFSIYLNEGERQLRREDLNRQMNFK